MVIKKVIDIAKRIEDTYDTKCYITGLGLRKRLKGQHLNPKDFNIIIEPCKKISYKALEEEWGYKILLEDNIYRILDIAVYIENIDTNMSRYITNVQKIFLTTDNELHIDGKAVLSIRKKGVDLKLEDLLEDDKDEIEMGKLDSVLNLRREGFSLFLNSNFSKYIDKNIVLFIFKKAIKHLSPNLMDTFLSFEGLYVLTEGRLYGHPTILRCFIEEMNSNYYTPLDKFLNKLFSKYDNLIKEKTGVTNCFEFYDKYKTLVYILLKYIISSVPLDMRNDKKYKHLYLDLLEFMGMDLKEGEEVIEYYLNHQFLEEELIDEYKNCKFDGSIFLGLVYSKL